jgi:hypothetical protein
MPVTSVGSTPVRVSAPAPAPGPAAAAVYTPAPTPTPAANPAGGPVGHGVTRLKPRPAANALHPTVFAGAAPPRGETAGAHGAHRGRISIR